MKPTPTILITGAEGQLGFELARAFAPFGNVVALGRQQLDLANKDQIIARCREISPQLILNPAAYTAVDRAESEPELALQVNATAPQILAEEAKRLGALLVHYSTDYVFNGNAQEPYRESDAPDPQSVYGRTKLLGEQAVTTVAGEHLVLRTSWLYGNRKQNFYRTMLRLAKERDELRVVADQIGSPTWVKELADVSAAAVEAVNGLIQLKAGSGIYHLTAAGETSWADFARSILASAPDESKRAKQVVSITTAEYPTPAKRPAYSVLSNAKFHAAFGMMPRDWRAQLADCVLEASVSPPKTRTDI